METDEQKQRGENPQQVAILALIWKNQSTVALSIFLIIDLCLHFYSCAMTSHITPRDMPVVIGRAINRENHTEQTILRT